MLEAIQVIRDVVLILSFAIITGTVVLVGRDILRLTRKVNTVRSVAAAAVTGMANPVGSVRRVLLALTRRSGH